MLGPCSNHIWPSYTFGLARALKFLSVIQFSPWDNFLECLFLYSSRTIFGPCWGQVYPRLALSLASALKFLSPGRSGLQNTTLIYLIFITMQGHVWSLFGLGSIPGYIEIWNFEDYINWVWGIYQWNFIFWDHVMAMFGLYWSNGWCTFTFTLS